MGQEFHGADTDALLAFEDRVRTGAEGVDDAVHGVVSRLEVVSWSGPDRDRAVESAHHLLDRTRQLHSLLEDAAEEIRSHAEEQDIASQPDWDGPGPGEMGFGPINVPLFSGSGFPGIQNAFTFGPDDFDPLDWIVGTAEQAAGWTWDNIGVPVVNGIASFGQAMIDNPAATGTMLLGLGMMAVGAAGEGVGIALLPTGLVTFGGGTAAGGVVIVGSTELIAAGAALTGIGGGVLLAEAANNPQSPASPRQPQSYQPSSGGGPARPPRDVLGDMHPGRNSGVRTVGSDAELQTAYDQMARGGEIIRRPGYRGQWVRQPDGTEIGLRETSSSGGRTIDVRYPDGTTTKVHIQ